MIEADCETLYLVGDILDYWYEYKTVVPRGYVRFFGKLAQMSDRGIRITWLIGNHDIWIFDYLPTEIGLNIVDGSVETTIEGKKFYISHGDGLGKIDLGFKFLRSIFRNKLCRFFYSAIHPGLTIPFAMGWSKSSRKGSEKYKCESDLVRIRLWAKEFSDSHPEVDYIVLGHFHQLVDEKINKNTRFIVLGDWINKFTYGIFDGKEFMLKKYC